MPNWVLLNTKCIEEGMRYLFPRHCSGQLSTTCSHLSHLDQPLYNLLMLDSQSYSLVSLHLDSLVFLLTSQYPDLNYAAQSDLLWYLRQPFLGTQPPVSANKRAALPLASPDRTPMYSRFDSKDWLTRAVVLTTAHATPDGSGVEVDTFRSHPSVDFPDLL